MTGFALHRRSSADGATGVFHFYRRISRSADRASVTVLVFRGANRTSAFNETIGKEHLVGVTVKLFDVANFSMTRVAHLRVKSFGQFFVLGVVGRAIKIELNSKVGKV